MGFKKMDKKDLLKLIEDDDLGLLKVKPKTNAAEQADDRLLNSFKEINEFFKKNNKEPTANKNDVKEFQLFSRLSGIRSDSAKSEKLKPFDEYGLLGAKKPIASVADIFSDDDLNLLNDGPNSIFDLKHVPKEKVAPDYIAKRKPCKDFEKFRAIFQQCHADLANKQRFFLPFTKEKQMTEGAFFVLKGLLLYIAEIKDDEKNKRSPRLRIIFENETEADLLGHSLGSQLYRDGRRVSEHNEKLLDGFNNIDSNDEHTGFIYVLKSLSERSDIKQIADLYKVGFSSVPVEQRIKDAAMEPTFLMSPVKIVTTFKCYNVSPQKLELLLHKFFGSACLDVDVYDANGKRFVPREWFIAPLEVIEQTVHFILSGEIVDFEYDPHRKIIVARKESK